MGGRSQRRRGQGVARPCPRSPQVARRHPGVECHGQSPDAGVQVGPASPWGQAWGGHQGLARAENGSLHCSVGCPVTGSEMVPEATPSGGHSAGPGGCMAASPSWTQTRSSWEHGRHGPQRHPTLPSCPQASGIPDTPSMIVTPPGCSPDARKLVCRLLSVPEGIRRSGLTSPPRPLWPGGHRRWRSQDLTPGCLVKGLDS